MAVAWAGLGDYGRARQMAGRALVLSREADDRMGSAVALYVLGTVAHASGEHERATLLLKEGLPLSVELEDEANIAYYLQSLAAVAASGDDPARAARLWGAARALLETVEATAYPHRPDESTQQALAASARTRLGEASWDAAWEEGSAMPRGRAIRYALSSDGPAKDSPVESPTPRTNRPSDPLTRRERHVAILVGQGLSNRRISEELGIAHRTVEGHVGNILNKLGLRSRTQIAAWVVEGGTKWRPGDPDRRAGN